MAFQIALRFSQGKTGGGTIESPAARNRANGRKSFDANRFAAVCQYVEKCLCSFVKKNTFSRYRRKKNTRRVNEPAQKRKVKKDTIISFKYVLL